jgi:hypothetical protein
VAVEVLVAILLLAALELRGKATQVLQTKLMAPVTVAAEEVVLVLLGLLLTLPFKVEVVAQALHLLYQALQFNILEGAVAVDMCQQLLFFQLRKHWVLVVAVMVAGLAD